MTKSDILKKLEFDFSEEDANRLRKPYETVSNMSKADRIIVDEDLMYYLRDYFCDVFVGEPIPKVFSNALIEWRRKKGTYRLYVTFPEDRPEYVYIDVYYVWDFLGKIIFPNIRQDDWKSSEDENIHHCIRIESPTKDPRIYDSRAIDSILQKSTGIFAFAYLYVQANMNVEEICTVDTVYVDSGDSAEQSLKKSKKTKNKKAGKRDKVFIPRKRRIYTVKKTAQTENNLREYIYSRWKVRGYTYQRKDGRVITVKEHYKNRHLPNKGIEKEGKDYILQKKEDVAE